jgi:hypothetical protein
VGFGIAYLFEHFIGLHHKYNNPFKEIDPFSEDNVIVLLKFLLPYRVVSFEEVIRRLGTILIGLDQK